MINEQHELNFTERSITTKNDSKKNSFRQILNKLIKLKNQKKKKENHAFSKNLDKLKKSKNKRRKLLKKIINLKNIVDEYKN